MVQKCPSCGSETIKSLALVYASGVAETSSRGAGVLVGSSVGVALGKTKGSQQTLLSQMAAPPQKKSVWRAVGLGFLIYMGLVMAVTMSSVSSEATETASTALPASFNAAVLIGIGAMVFLGYRAHRWNKMEYPMLHADWARRFMCERCGHVFA
jgi:hypothetical protein